MKGKIRKLARGRGFGFIATKDSKDIFFHRSALTGREFDSLEEGIGVEFKLKRGPKGLRAINIRVSDTSCKQGVGLMQAYCLKCRVKREVKEPESITMKNGRPATKGVCLVCGTKVSVI